MQKSNIFVPVMLYLHHKIFTKMKHTCLISIIIAALYGCSSTNSKEAFDFGSFRPIEGTEILEDFELMRAGRIVAMDKGFIFADHDGEYCLSYCPSDTTSLPIRIAPVGQGPLEFINTGVIYYNQVDSSLYLYDSQVKRAFLFAIENDSVVLDKKHLIKDEILSSTIGYDVLPAGKRFVTNGVFDRDMFALLDSKGKLITTFGKYPGDNRGIEEPFSFYAKNNNHITVSPDGTRLMVAGSLNDWVAFYDLTDEQPRLIREYFTTDPISQARKTDSATTSLVYNNEDVYHYSDLVPTKNHVYALYDGRTVVERKNGTRKPKYVLQFDWEGNLTDGFRIDDRFVSLAASPDDSAIYGVVAMEGDELIIKRYPI